MFLKSKYTKVALAIAVVYQILMLGAFLPGYSSYPGKVEELSVAIVNLDDEMKEVTKELKGNIPLEVIELPSLEKAKKELDSNKIDLIIHIPENFTEILSGSSQKPQIDYYINGAAATLVVSAINEIVTSVDRSLNESIGTNKGTVILQSFNLTEEKANELASTITSTLDANIVKINKVPEGMHNLMSPFMLSMASYVVSLIASLMLYNSYKQFKSKSGKWTTWLYVEIIALTISVITPIIGTGILYFLTSYGFDTFVKIGLTEALMVFVAFQFNFIMLLLLDISGVAVNMGFMFMQVISNGALFSRTMMYPPYEIISYISPMYYSVAAVRSWLFGGGNPLDSLIYLLILGLITFILTLLSVKFSRHKPNGNEVIPF